ncbi:MAG: hypothetical protein Q9187_006191 [Circinaria calcarea]
MPTTRITLSLNSKQSQRAPLLVSSSTSLDPTSNDSCRALVIKTAQSKLRLKKASRVFVAGTGKELINEFDWKHALKDDVVLLVSAGEEYVGLKKEEPKASDDDPTDMVSLRLGNPDCSIVNLADRATIDPLSITQLETTAHTLPGIIHAVAQPDLHPGTKFPIGAVFVSDGWIHPPLIGGDIGCGMAWYKTKLTPSQVEGEKGRKLAEKLRRVEGPWRTQQNRLTWLTDSSTSESFTCHSAGEEWDASLGTIGAGNHFAELQVVEEILDGNWKTNNTFNPQQILNEGEVVLLVHSGSRGFGGDILKRYTSDDRTSMRSSDPAASNYLEEHDRACAWAVRNRDLIALRFLACIEPGQESWDLGINDPNSSTTAEDIQTAARAVECRKVVDICHNNVEATSWPPSPSSSTANATSSKPRVFIHRKGAAPTHHLLPSSTTNPSHQQTQPQPLSILPLPGSRGTPTLILHPLHTHQNSYGLHHALSLAHGAGRALSRAKALASLPAKYNHKPDDLLRGDFVKTNAKGNKNVARDDSGRNEGEKVKGGVWVVCEEKALVWEEAVEAYKDVWDVGADLVQAGVAERVGWCRGRVSYKVRKS